MAKKKAKVKLVKSSKSKLLKKSNKRRSKKMPFGVGDDKPSFLQSLTKKSEPKPVEVSASDEKLNKITAVLKNRMNARHLNEAVKDIKSILES